MSSMERRSGDTNRNVVQGIRGTMPVRMASHHGAMMLQQAQLMVASYQAELQQVTSATCRTPPLFGLQHVATPTATIA